MYRYHSSLPAMKQLSTLLYRTFGLTLAAIVAMVAVASGAPLSAQAQSNDDPDESEIRRNYSLYWEDFRNENYEMALPNLEWILEHAPHFPRDDDRNFRRAIEAYENLAQRTDDEEQRLDYIQRGIDILENAPERIRERELSHDEFRWMRIYGRFMQMFGRYVDDPPMTELDAYMAAYELDPERLDPYFIDRIIQGLIEKDRQEALDFMDQLEEVRTDDEVQQMITDVRDDLFESPEERYDFVKSRLENDPDNPELLEERYNLEERLGLRSEMYDTAERLLELQPTAQAYFDIGNMYLDDGEPDEAYTRFERALEQDDLSEELEIDIQFEMGTAQRQQGNLQQARSHFRNVLNLDSSQGRAYLAIGDLYTQAVADCEGPLEREDRAVYWLAVEYYERAKEADPGVSRSADQKINTFRQYFPTQEMIFFRDDWNPGESFRIDYGCYAWINETTTVRSPR